MSHDFFHVRLHLVGFDRLRHHEQTRMLFEEWLDAWRDPNAMTQDWSHAQMVFTINQPGNKVYINRWQLLEADQHSVAKTVEVSGFWLYHNSLSLYVQNFLLMYGIHAGTHGSMTVQFNPGKLSFDVFEDRANPLFAGYLIDLDEERKRQDAIANKIINNPKGEVQ